MSSPQPQDHDQLQDFSAYSIPGIEAGLYIFTAARIDWAILSTRWGYSPSYQSFPTFSSSDMPCRTIPPWYFP